MTVNELITKLQSMPQDMLVFDDSGFEVDDVKINDEFYNCDSARPDAKPITVVQLT